MRVSVRDAEARPLRDRRRGRRRYSLCQFCRRHLAYESRLSQALFWLRFVLTFGIIESNSVDS